MRNKIRTTIFISFISFILLAIVFSRSLLNLSKHLIFIFQKPNIEYVTLPSDIEQSLEDYPQLKKIVAKANITLPLEIEDVPQGITTTEDGLIFITVYDYKEKTYSKCYILDQNGNLLNTVTLDMASHVGSIAYDEQNELFWIPDDDGSLVAYKKDEMLNQSNVFSQVRFEKIGLSLKDSKEQLSNYIDYLTVDGKSLFIGSFSQKNKGILHEYKIRQENGQIKLLKKSEIALPTRIQGITFYDRGLEKYMILSRSFGRQNDSEILVYRYKENMHTYSEQKTRIALAAPPLLEQISVHGGSLYAIFESSSKKYHNSKVVIPNILILDTEAILSLHGQ